ncbi:MerR family transcriptional regulator [Sulfoacidibacillus thermotolerans]|uniref:HTH merR-type domain-containing protein n=1 Tax=Sulfoacidibacillus thermotolerans TaxID=1765684 RepID=A0A2U3D1Q7_SULT2|nr:MerR family transcriptional regulator [Sulfoacidibacillus thermotolerans]PWI55174.1 hypothetical protein BM613_13445 [Sulfoacidibacillus thermotolerans]
MRIGEFVRTLNTTHETVRHYEQVGLLCPARDGNQKHYFDDHIQVFEIIQELKNIGFSLEDILLLFELRASVGCGSEVLIHEVKRKFANQIANLDNQIHDLTIRRDNLREMLDELSKVVPK